VIFFGVLVFVIAEIVSFVAVAGQIGFAWAVVLLLVVSALGPFVVRRVGVGVLAHTQERLARGELPTRELLDGFVVLVAGLMICIPGFISDALGLLLMIGPVRHLLIRTAGRRLARRVPTIRIRGWRPNDGRPRAEFDQPLLPSDSPDRALGPGEEV
jgi:UPF0716 protein FxsA